MNAKELSENMARSVGVICEHLLPNGKKRGGEWCVGSSGGDAGESLKVRLIGEKAGIWSDFATSQSGDLLDLWMLVRSCNLMTAITQASELLGVKRDSRIGSQKTYTKPAKGIFKKAGKRVIEWLTETRKLTPAAIAAYKVASKDDTYAVFPFLIDGELTNFKARNIENKKDMRVHPGGAPHLFGWQAISDNARSVTICEGEIDAITLWQYGFPALSVFSGANNLQWIDVDYDRLDRFSEIFICMDGDEAGMQAVPQIVERLGNERCRVVRLPKKDANQCLQDGITKEQIAECFAAAVFITPETLRRPMDFYEGVMREFYPEDDRDTGIFLPWPKTFEFWRLRDSELTVWTGINGHGKSLMLGYVMVNAIEQGERVCIASLEMPARKTLMRIVRQISGQRVPAKHDVEAILTSLAEKLWIVDLVGTADPAAVLESFRYARKRFGVTQFVVDSLTKVVRKDDDYNAQKDAVESFVDFKNQVGGHIHLVTHARKGQGEDTAPRKMDIKGSSSITDLADNVCSVWRNKAKDDGSVDAGAADAVLYLDKQRNGEWEGAISLWFDKQSMQYREDALSHVKRHTIESKFVEEVTL
jgi:twinkle protein